MPGMMDTVLNIGLNDEAVIGLTEKSGNERFVWDSYRRFVQMYGDVVLGLKPASKEEIDPFEKIIDEIKKEKGVSNDTELTAEDLKELVARFKKAIKEETGNDFPEDPWTQLWGAILAVFDSWNTERATYYRQINNISDDWGTAVNVQAMVYGNMGNNSATGVAFTRDAGSGEDIFNGEYLINAQGEDVVAGIRTPQEITLEGSKRWAELTGTSETERKNCILLSKKLCLNYTENSVKSKQNWKTIIKICRIWNSPSRMENCGLCKPEMEREQVLPWLRWLSICSNRE